MGMTILAEETANGFRLRISGAEMKPTLAAIKQALAPTWVSHDIGDELAENHGTALNPRFEAFKLVSIHHSVP